MLKYWTNIFLLVENSIIKTWRSYEVKPIHGRIDRSTKHKSNKENDEYQEQVERNAVDVNVTSVSQHTLNCCKEICISENNQNTENEHDNEIPVDITTENTEKSNPDLVRKSTKNNSPYTPTTM